MPVIALVVCQPVAISEGGAEKKIEVFREIDKTLLWCTDFRE